MYTADGKTNGPAFSWPDGKRIAVMVTFDYDAEFLRMSRAKSKGTSIGFTDFSRGQYGPHEGLARCLDMLETMNIKSTFFVPGAVIETYRDTVEEIHRRGHELACHGYQHESSPELTRYIEDFQTWVPADGASIGLECTSLHGIITLCVKNKVPRPGFAEALRAAFEAEGIKVLEAAELGTDNT